MGHLESVPLPDADAVRSLLGSGFDHLGDERAAELTALLGGVAATAGGGAGVVLPFVVQSLASEKVIEYGGDIDEWLTDYAEGLDEDDRKQAALAKVAGGVSRLLPDGEELREASLAAGRGNPEALFEVLERYQDDEQRAELERAIEDLLAGRVGDSREEFVERLQEEFGTDTPEEAVALFREFRDLLEEDAVRETLDAVLEVEVKVDALQDELDATRAELNDGLDALFQAELGDEGFRRLTPTYLDRQPADAKVAFRAGFELVEIAAGYAMERRRRDAEETVEEELLELLRDAGENVVVLGPPGSGKSTVCMQVAVEWYAHQHGTVLYRDDGPPTFKNPEVLRQAIRQGDGHVLVVAEDAMREPAREVLDVMEEFDHRTNVSFLLDSRRREWTDEGDAALDSRTSVHVNSDVKQRQVPPLHSEECERLVEHFQNVADSNVSPDPERLLKRVRSDKVQDEWPGDAAPGEIYLVLQSLSWYADPLGDHGDAKTPTPLKEDVQRVYDTLAERGETALDVGVTANLLNAGGFGLYRELVYALASDTTARRTEDVPDHEFAEIEAALTELTGHVVFERRDSARGEETTPPFRGMHEAWSVAFLDHALDAEQQADARKRFGRCVTQMLSLADDGELRKRIDDALEGGVGYLDEVESDPTEWADDWVDKLLSFGDEYPGLAMLFGTHEYERIRLPEACSEVKQLELLNQRGGMYLEGGYLDEAESEFDKLGGIADIVLESEETKKRWQAWSFGNLGLVFQTRGNLDVAEKYHLISFEIKESIGDTHEAAKSLTNLGVVAGKLDNLDAAEEYFQRSLSFNRSIGDYHNIAKSINNLGLIAQKRGDLNTAEDYHLQSLNIERDIGNDHGVAKSLGNLGLVARKRGNLDDAEKYFKRSLDIERGIGDDHGAAKSLHNLGLVEQMRGNLVSARERYEEVKSIFRDIGAVLDVLIALNNLTIVCHSQGDKEAAMKYCKQGIQLADEHNYPRQRQEFKQLLRDL